MTHFIVSFILITGGKSSHQVRNYTPEKLQGFYWFWQHGQHCPGPKCAQVTGVNISRVDDKKRQ